MTVGEFLDLKAQKDNSRIPEYRYFDPEDTTKEILWKIVMCTRNVIVCLDKTTNRVLATIGLMELFNLYVQCSWNEWCSSYDLILLIKLSKQTNLIYII